MAWFAKTIVAPLVSGAVEKASSQLDAADAQLDAFSADMTDRLVVLRCLADRIARGNPHAR